MNPAFTLTCPQPSTKPHGVTSHNTTKGIGNVRPITCHESTEGKKKYNSTFFKLDFGGGVGWVVNVTRRQFYPLVPIVGPRTGLNGCGKSRPYWVSMPGPLSP